MTSYESLWFASKSTSLGENRRQTRNKCFKVFYSGFHQNHLLLGRIKYFAEKQKQVVKATNEFKTFILVRSYFKEE